MGEPGSSFEPVDITRESLLETRGEAKLSAGKTGKIARLLLVARYEVEQGTMTEAAQGFFEGVADETFTGGLMFFDGSGYSKVVFVVLEASSKSLEAFVTGPVSNMLLDARVLNWSDDLNARAWPVFGTAVINSPAGPDMMEGPELNAALGTVMINAAKLGRSLRDLAEADAEDLSAKIAEGSAFHPAANFLVSALGTPTFFTLARYAELFLQPAKLGLASEKVWPSQELRLTY
eukprot:COSAG02_NODE_2521_length_8609_cov_3.772503_4_plen_234_part_00